MSAASARAPAIFFGHGSPMNALPGAPGALAGDARYAQAWRALGGRIEKPKAVLMVSAHWYGEGAKVATTPAPETIHDFFGFPEALHQVRYPASGAPALAEAVAARIGAARDAEWGLDHGAWSVLIHAFPDADVPVAQLSLDARRDGAAHYALGRALRPLRDEGVLIAGSGDVVHNLRLMDRRGEGFVHPWAERFHAFVKARIAAGDHAALLAPQGEDARLSIPTPDHYWPLLYVLAAAHEGETPHFFTDEIALASISMLGVAFGV
ncbi:MAG: 4,5-DOPA dioxygenase extradiol [Hydrogenophilaceae bacterium]|jgi:4,5-DOPA dioxygenase extradiol|nr:4,5-DOPA dioxygenase extradiol [Hydrogenophilaceae bacterium]